MKSEPWFQGVGPNKKAVDTPNCIGTYEAGNISCDGLSGPVRSSACIVKPLCIRATKWCSDSEIDPVLLAGLDLFFISDLVEGLVSKDLTISRSLRTKSYFRKRGQLYSLISHFENCLRDRFGITRFQGVPGAPNRPVAFRPGKFYTITRPGVSPQGLTWFCVGAARRDIPLAKIFPHYGRSRAFLNISLRVSLEQLDHLLIQQLFDRLRVRANPQSNWKSSCYFLDAEGVGAVANIVKRLVDSRLICIPEIEE